MLDFILNKSLNLLINLKYLGLFISSLGFPVPIEMIISVLATKGNSIYKIALISGSGSVLGYLFPYLLGYIFTIKNPDTWLGGRARFLRFDKEKIEKSRKRIIKGSFFYITLTRFLPWLRVAASMAAGFFRVNIFKHSLAVFIGMFTYSLIIAYIGKKVEGDLSALITYLKMSDKWLIAIVVTFAIIYLGFRLRKQIARLIIKISKK
ncbi:MAG TPA: VTT domain-containing protein [Candidatus Dojkabacteria bacterium]|nr:VTT domain-containing protein [Candidatus Dojkabacteria bacterium]